MGCGASNTSSSKHDYSGEVGPDGPLSDAPAQLIVSGHQDALYNGIYNRGPEAWNGKAVYFNTAGRVIYYYNAADGGAPSWSFDNRNQQDSKGTKDWYHGGFLDSIVGGPAFPPLCAGGQLADNEEEDEMGRVSIFEMTVAPPPPALRIDGHPNDDADGVYTLQADLWNGRPHYKSSAGWVFYYYASNEGGQSGWGLHDEDNPGGQRDLCAGGWVGPYNWSHPPVGPSVGFNDEGRCSVIADGGDPSMAAHVQQLLMQYRQGQVTMLGASSGQMPASPMMMQPGMPMMQPGMAMMQPAVPMMQPMAGAMMPVVPQQPVMVAQPMMVAQPVMAQPAAMAVPMAQPV